MDTAKREISGFVITTGLRDVTAAHIHDGSRGVSGPVIVPLAGGPDVWTVPEGALLTPEQVARFNEGGLYYNVPTTANPDGAVRGQIDLPE